MKAIFFRQHGDASVLEYGDQPMPEAKPGEALIKVSAVALNHLDIWVRRGWPGLTLLLPHIGGSDIVGSICSLNGDSSFALDDRVSISPGYNLTNDEWTGKGEDSVSPEYRIIGEHCAGGLAEYVTVPIENLCRTVVDRSDAEIAATLLTGVTAWRMLTIRGRLQRGESVLVVGTGGGVNSLTIQLATHLGASVIALAGNTAKAALAKKLGATHVINYQETPEWHRKVLGLTAKRGVDLVIDNVGQETFSNSLKSLCRGGRLVTVGNTRGFALQIDNRLIFGKQLSIIGSTMGSKHDFTSVQQFIEKNRISPAIDCVAPLSDGIHHLRRLEKGEQAGKIILQPDL